MASSITRWIRLMLDKTSANKAEADIKKTLGGVEGGLEKLGAMAKRVGGMIAAALGVRAMIRFGEASVEAAMVAEKAWTNLAGTIDAAGESFVGLEAGIRAAAAAFQDSTIHDGEAYAEGLTRLVSLTGDVKASLNNMGFAANVAAQFFGGDLQAGIDAVAKGMNTGVIMINRMRFSMEDVNRISLGAAAREANTFAGQVKQLGNAWDDFKEELGLAMIEGARGTGLLEQLKAAVQNLTAWVTRNGEQLRDWAMTGIQAAARGAGLLGSTIGVLTSGFLVLTGAILGTLSAANGLHRFFTKAFGKEDPWGDWLINSRRELDQLLESAVALTNTAWPLALNGINTAGPGANPFRHDKPRPTTPPPMAGKRLTGTGAGAAPGSSGASDIPDWWWKSAGERAAQAAREAAARLGPIAMGAALEATMRSGGAGDFGAVGDLLNGLNAELGALETQADAFGSTFDLAGARVSAFDSAIASLASIGTPAAIAAIDSLKGSLDGALKAMELGEEQALNYGLAVDTLSSLIAGAVGGDLKQVAKAKAKQNSLMAAEELAMGLVASLSLFGAVNAPKHFLAAAKFGAIAAAWGGFGAGLGGGASGGGAGGVGTASAASGKASAAAKAPESEIHIHLVGPGFDALNPEVQRVVFGAQQQARERFGANAKISLVRHSR